MGQDVSADLAAFFGSPHRTGRYPMADVCSTTSQAISLKEVGTQKRFAGAFEAPLP